MISPFLFRVSLDKNFAFFTFSLVISPGIEGRAAVVGWRAEARPIIFMQIHIKKSFAPSATSAVIASSQFTILNRGRGLCIRSDERAKRVVEAGWGKQFIHVQRTEKVRRTPTIIFFNTLILNRNDLCSLR